MMCPVFLLPGSRPGVPRGGRAHRLRGAAQCGTAPAVGDLLKIDVHLAKTCVFACLKLLNYKDYEESNITLVGN